MIASSGCIGGAYLSDGVAYPRVPFPEICFGPIGSTNRRSRRSGCRRCDTGLLFERCHPAGQRHNRWRCRESCLKIKWLGRLMSARVTAEIARVVLAHWVNVPPFQLIPPGTCTPFCWAGCGGGG